MAEGRAQRPALDDLAVVVQPDPRRRRQAVPLVQREPDRVAEWKEDERRVDGEGRQDVEVADPPRLARRPAATFVPRQPELVS